MYSSNVGTLALCCLFLQGFTEVTGKSSPYLYEKPCSDWRRPVWILIRYLHILQSSLSKTESVRTEAVLVTVCLSLCWLWEGKENYQGRGGEKVNKKLAKRDKWRMTLMECTEQNMCLENKDGRILWAGSDGNFQRSFFVVLACNFFF